ncbi:unnamed protein product [Dicrocoelium dendriticum]|nr:unnamed protein product [Dicrocoelium dendriticum]
MSVEVRIKYLDGLTGKGDRVIKGTFREKKLVTKAANGRDSVYFGQTLLWPVSRPLDDKDSLILAAYHHRKGKPDSLLGTVTVNLYSLTRETHLSLRENLVDGSRRATSMILSFELAYQSPDSRIGGLDQQGLIFPTTPMDYGLEEMSIDRGSLSQLEAG